MADEKIFKDEILDDETLDNVAGGTRLETFADGNELYKRGLLSAEDALSSAPVRDVLHKMGYSGYKDNGGIMNANIYTDKEGNTITREQFWKNFNTENGTKIIR
ncbi:MAG: hypothetical protein IKO05_06865 [Selenomonadaceae bacterium]|nr:hypothetical protein [Selenomonadaceae bacterium]